MVSMSWKQLERLVKRYGLPIAETSFISSINTAKQSAKNIGYPVVLKIFSETGLHKTKVRGVALNIKHEKELVKAYEKIKNNLKKTKTRVHGFLVQEKISGQEVLVGMKQSNFGPAIAFGLGGVFVEILQDFSLRIAPVNKEQAQNMIKEIKAYKILKNKKCNINSIIEIITKISRLSIENPDIKEIDFNPVIVNTKQARIVDIRIIK